MKWDRIGAALLLMAAAAMVSCAAAPPRSHPSPSTSVAITADEAEAAARARAEDATSTQPLSAEQKAGLPARSMVTTAAIAKVAIGRPDDRRLPDAAPVWLVTVRGDLRLTGGYYGEDPAPMAAHVYSVEVDATSGQVVNVSAGVDLSAGIQAHASTLDERCPPGGGASVWDQFSRTSAFPLSL